MRQSSDRDNKEIYLFRILFGNPKNAEVVEESAYS